MTRVGTAPTQFFGGKTLLAPRIIALFPPHKVYVEPFIGAGAVYFSHPPSALEIINDKDGLIVNFFRVLRDPAKGARLRAALELTPYAREEWGECLSGLKAVERGWDSAADDVEVARRWFVHTQMSFAGRIARDGAYANNGWEWARTAEGNRIPAYRGAIDRLPQFTARLANAQIEHDDALAVIARYDTKHTLCYLDPPYEPSTRRGGGYAHEMTTDDHVRLLDLITAPSFKSMVILSGYDSTLYRERLEVTPPPERRWRRIEITVACSAAGRVGAGGGKLQGKGAVYRAGQTRTEVLWLNPAAQARQGLWAGMDGEPTDDASEPPAMPPTPTRRQAQRPAKAQPATPPTKGKMTRTTKKTR